MKMKRKEYKALLKVLRLFFLGNKFDVHYTGKFLGPFQTSCYCRAELNWSN